MSRAFATTTNRTADAQRRLPEHPSELFLQIHITDVCNLRCRHCYMTRRNTRSMSRDLFTLVLTQFQELCRAVPHGKHWVQITGGEPLQHPEWPWFLAEAQRRISIVRLMTNGVGIGRSAARTLGHYCNAIQVSVDGLESTHDAIRGPGSFRRALQGIRQLRRLGIFVSVKMTVMKVNQSEVLPLFDALKKEVCLFSVARYVPTGPEEFPLLPDGQVYADCLKQLFAQWQAGEKVSLREPFFGLWLRRACRDSCFQGCGAANTGLTVTETGEILPCRRLPVSLGNVYQTTLQVAYQDHDVARLLRARLFHEPCGACAYVANCGGSRCVVWALTGDLAAPDPGCPLHAQDARQRSLTAVVGQSRSGVSAAKSDTRGR